MAYRSVPGLPTKKERAELLLMALAALLVRGGERVALLGTGLPPSGNKVTLNRLAMTLGRHPAAGRLAAGRALPRHAQIVLIGDLLSPLPRDPQDGGGAAAAGGCAAIWSRCSTRRGNLAVRWADRVRGDGRRGRVADPPGRSCAAAYMERWKPIAMAGGACAGRGVELRHHRTDRPPQTALLALYGAIAQEPTS